MKYHFPGLDVVAGHVVTPKQALPSSQDADRQAQPLIQAGADALRATSLQRQLHQQPFQGYVSISEGETTRKRASEAEILVRMGQKGREIQVGSGSRGLSSLPEAGLALELKMSRRQPLVARWLVPYTMWRAMPVSSRSR